MWFPGYASAVSFGLVTSSTTATLGAGGWLGLTRQGLPPCKKRQAFLAHNGLELSCPAEAGRLPPLYAWPAGAASTNYRPARRVSISELIAGPLFGSHSRAATLGHDSQIRRSSSWWLSLEH